MQGLIRRTPFESTPLDRVLTQFFNDPFFAPTSLAGLVNIEEGTLALDVSEDEKNVIVRASLPGFKKDNISVEIHDGVLSINAQQTEETEEKSERFYRKERRTGSVSRRLALPSDVVEDETHAELKDGVLTLRMPKKHAKNGPRKVKIG